MPGVSVSPPHTNPRHTPHHNLKIIIYSKVFHHQPTTSTNNIKTNLLKKLITNLITPSPSPPTTLPITPQPRFPKNSASKRADPALTTNTTSSAALCAPPSSHTETRVRLRWRGVWRGRGVWAVALFCFFFQFFLVFFLSSFFESCVCVCCVCFFSSKH